MSELEWVFCPWCSNKHGWGVGGTTPERLRDNLARVGFEADSLGTLSVNQMLALSHFRDYDTQEAMAAEIHRIKDYYSTVIRTRFNSLRISGEMASSHHVEYTTS